LTVLIGRNDSGKSVFLSAVETLINARSAQPTDVWRATHKLLAEIVAETSVGPCHWNSSGGTQSNVLLQPVLKYHFPSQGVPMQSPGHADTKGPPLIGGAGEMVPAVFDYLLRQQRQRFFAAKEALLKLIPGLVDLNIGTPTPQERRIDLLLEGGFSLPADEASAGVRLMLTFVALAYHPTPPRVILLEEPETGVHPRRLAEIVSLLRAITRGEHGERPAQVIMTTHSPHLLSFIDADEDQVLVFRRQPDGARTADPVDREKLKVFMDEFTLGEVWFNEGEEGLVKSV
ncbi:MAG: AAA family ATPase, partial [Gemmataceae bacterium]